MHFGTLFILANLPSGVVFVFFLRLSFSSSESDNTPGRCCLVLFQVNDCQVA